MIRGPLPTDHHDDNNKDLKNIIFIQCNPSSAYPDISSLINNNYNIDAVVNLAGENIFGKWD